MQRSCTLCIALQWHQPALLCNGFAQQCTCNGTITSEHRAIVIFSHSDAINLPLLYFEWTIPLMFDSERKRSKTDKY